MATKTHSQVYVEYLKNKYITGDSNKYFKEFEKLNTTTDSIYNLGDLDVFRFVRESAKVRLKKFLG